MLDTLVSLFAPHSCLGCTTEGGLLCVHCIGRLPRSAERCYRCKALSAHGRTCPPCRRVTKLYSVQVATSYQDIAKELIARLKFSGARAAAVPIAATMSHLTLPDDCVIIPIPTATSRVRRRGYDQAALIAKAIAWRQSKEYDPCLRRVGQHRQVGASRLHRLEQMKDSFVVVDTASVRGRTIVLVDDVVTTGSTLESAAAALKAAGAKRVKAVVFARA